MSYYYVRSFFCELLLQNFLPFLNFTSVTPVFLYSLADSTSLFIKKYPFGSGWSLIEWILHLRRLLSEHFSVSYITSLNTTTFRSPMDIFLPWYLCLYILLICEDIDCYPPWTILLLKLYFL